MLSLRTENCDIFERTFRSDNVNSLFFEILSGLAKLSFWGKSMTYAKKNFYAFLVQMHVSGGDLYLNKSRSSDFVNNCFYDFFCSHVSPPINYLYSPAKYIHIIMWNALERRLRVLMISGCLTFFPSTKQSRAASSNSRTFARSILSLV